MRSCSKIFVSLALALSALVSLAQPAGAVGSISIDEGTSFPESQVITVRYKGYTLYERVFVQQCWDDPSVATFDYSLSCAVSNMLAPPLVDRDEGTYKFKLFVGDEPSGNFPVSCGQKVNPDNEVRPTCWIRMVMTARERNDLSAWVPLTFENAKPSPATVAPPRPTIAEEPTVASSVSTDLVATTVVSATTAKSAPAASVAVTSVPPAKKSRSVLPYVLASVATALGAGLFAWKSRRRHSSSVPHVGKAILQKDRELEILSED
jgi:hypothetical protein